MKTLAGAFEEALARGSAPDLLDVPNIGHGANGGVGQSPQVTVERVLVHVICK